MRQRKEPVDGRPEWMTRQQVALLAQVSVRTVDRHIAQGLLEAKKTNGSVRIHRDAVAAWLSVALVLTLMLIAIVSDVL